MVTITPFHNHGSTENFYVCHVVMKTFFTSMVYLSLVFVLGCGNQVSLKGRVTFSDDGAPLTVGTVCFQNDKLLERGNIDASGYYTMGTFKDRDGLPPGEYQVFFALPASFGTDTSGKPVLISPVDSKYISPETSGLSLTVNASTKKYDIVVDRLKPVQLAPVTTGPMGTPLMGIPPRQKVSDELRTFSPNVSHENSFFFRYCVDLLFSGVCSGCAIGNSGKSDSPQNILGYGIRPNRRSVDET